MSPALPTRAQRLALAIERFPEHRTELEAREALLPAGSAICHGLFHPGHVLLPRSGPVVIDWPDACSGPAAYDVARSVVLMRYLGGFSAAAIQHHAALAQRYLDAYLERGGVERGVVERCMALPAFILLLRAPRHPDRPALERMASRDAT
jgi:aminoglycoside phosphotransferase (APT) family kinase protein